MRVSTILLLEQAWVWSRVPVGTRGVVSWLIAVVVLLLD